MYRVLLHCSKERKVWPDGKVWKIPRVEGPGAVLGQRLGGPSIVKKAERPAVRGFLRRLWRLPWALSRTWLRLGDPVEQKLRMLGKSLLISHRSLSNTCQLFETKKTGPYFWNVTIIPTGCHFTVERNMCSWWLAFWSSSEQLFLLTVNTFPKNSCIDGRFCVFKLLECESQGKCVLSQVIFLVNFPGTSKATAGLGIHSLVYGFVFFRPTSLAGWTGLGPSLGSCYSSQLAPLLPLGLTSGKPRGWARCIHNLEWQPQQGALLSLALCAVLLRGPSRHQYPAKATSLARRPSSAVISSIALECKHENLRPSLTLSSSAVRDNGIPELCIQWTTTNGITQSTACPWQEESQGRKIKQVQTLRP